MQNISAVIVTYNRLELLKLCLAAVELQTTSLTSIIVINNNSIDGTHEFLENWQNSKPANATKRFIIHSRSNIGGAGGFHHGIKYAVEINTDWVWIMDDDVIPQPDALNELLNAAKFTSGPSGYYSSVATDESGKCTVNVPTIDMTLAIQGYPNWGEYLKNSIVKIHESTFVSLLLSRESIIKIGLPIKDFFIWGDDTEYTQRMARNGIQGYWVGRSQVIHLRPSNNGLNIRTETDSSRIYLYRYLYRNRIYISRSKGASWLGPSVRNAIFDMLSLLIIYRNPKKSLIIARGIISALFFKPRIDMVPKGE